MRGTKTFKHVISITCLRNANKKDIGREKMSVIVKAVGIKG